jgi:hypothetical protein
VSAESNPDPNFITNANPDPSPDLNPGKTVILYKKTVKTLFLKSVSDQNLYEIILFYIYYAHGPTGATIIYIFFLQK